MVEGVCGGRWGGEGGRGQNFSSALFGTMIFTNYKISVFFECTTLLILEKIYNPSSGERERESVCVCVCTWFAVVIIIINKKYKRSKNHFDVTLCVKCIFLNAKQSFTLNTEQAFRQLAQ